MDIATACGILRRCNDEFLEGKEVDAHPLDAAAAVHEIKRYLEDARLDGKRIDELAISASMLLTPQGMRWIMPFVLSAEAMEASKRRKR